MRTLALLALAPVAVLAQSDTTRRAARSDSTRLLETVTVTAIRARDEAPIAASTIGEAEIVQRSFGQDVPLLLQTAPSLTAYNEAGNHWGYSYLRLRGIDQSRINLTLDGIPLNDPEDQVLYFADFPDLTNSLSSVQVQRGVGTSAPGTASYGGSINFQTMPVAAMRRGGDLQLQGGSFGSARASAEYATGLASNRVALYGRVSALQSSGYRRHSGSEGRSGFLGAVYAGDRDVLKLTVLAGLFSDTLAYLGASRAELAADRRHNPLRPDEVDRFGEQLTALSYTRYLGTRSSLATTVYRTSASGNYDVCIANCDQSAADLWNFHLDFVWYGATTTLNFERDRLRGSIGAYASTYARDHHAYARPDLTQSLYFNTGHKTDASAFAKLSYDVARLTLFGDLQLRRAHFRYEPDLNAGIPGRGIAWHFLNPKAGITLRVSPRMTARAFYGINGREPARSDMLGGFDNLDTTNASFVGPLDRVRAERVHDVEAGIRYEAGSWSIDANAFSMGFRNEILPVGELTYIGTPLRTNVRSSWRRGLEADLSGRPSHRLQLGMSATVMRGRIADFVDAASGQRYQNVDPLLTPRFTSVQRATVTMTRAFSLSGQGRYSSRSQLTNTGDASLVLPAAFVGDVAAHWTSGGRGLSLHVNNVGDVRRFGSGHVAFGEARYYVLPPRSVFLVARLGW
jgi:iron complex outermembrane recepter protein